MIFVCCVYCFPSRKKYHCCATGISCKLVSGAIGRPYKWLGIIIGFISKAACILPSNTVKASSQGEGFEFSSSIILLSPMSERYDFLSSSLIFQFGEIANANTITKITLGGSWSALINNTKKAYHGL